MVYIIGINLVASSKEVKVLGGVLVAAMSSIVYPVVLAISPLAKDLTRGV